MVTAATEMPRELAVKIERAQEHAAALLVENMEQYFGTRPYKIVIEPDDSGYLGHTAYITFSEPLPPIFAARTGEALYQLRSVLDHAVMLLSDVPPDSRATEFVITNSRESFHGLAGKRRLSDRLDAIRSPEARSFIEAVQPFNRVSADPDASPLWVLHELFMADKHRRLLLTQAGSHGSRVIPVYPGVKTISFATGALRPDTGGRARLANLTLTDPRQHVDLDLAPILTIAFADEPVARDKIVSSVLDDIIRFTAFVVSRLCEHL